jgi:hypothetical protein
MALSRALITNLQPLASNDASFTPQIDATLTSLRGRNIGM